MCGFPLKHLNKYLKTLVQDHKRFVAMCEEFTKPRILDDSKPVFERRITRIVTPGTLIDEPFLNQFENNYLLAISTAPLAPDDAQDGLSSCCGLAWMDVSTGEFFAKSVATRHLRDELVRIGPKEVVLEQQLSDDPLHPIRQLISEERLFVSYISSPAQLETDALFAERAGSDDLTSQADPLAPSLQIRLSQEESQAVKILTAFLHANLIEHMPRLPSLSREAAMNRMQIDAHTIKSLEIREGIREGGTTGSLLSVIKRTVTSGGTRLLARWLCKRAHLRLGK
jgi:DNA mismatch repair ATPase MutS